MTEPGRVQSHDEAHAEYHAKTAEMMGRDPSRLPNGEWRCVLDHRTEPCGDCSGCREVQDENRIAQNDPSAP